jgi:hypothetical protein
MDKEDWRIVKQRFAFPAGSLFGLSKTETEADMAGLRACKMIKEPVVEAVEVVAVETEMSIVQQQGGLMRALGLLCSYTWGIED